MGNEQVTVLMATFNGEKFIDAQINSLLNQSFQNWQLYIRDDLSADNTCNILQKYSDDHSNVHIVHDQKINVGSTQNFSKLIQAVKHLDGYVMFCDQDDYWLKDKIEASLDEMIEAEKKFSSTTALVVFTNFIYADSNLQPVSSKSEFSPVKFSDLKLSHILAQNPAYGCTMILNKSLIRLIGKIPAEAEHHDYWIALVAAAFGKICYLPKQTLLYRQHDRNISGLYDDDSFTKRFRRIIVQKKNLRDAESKVQMAKAFKNAYINNLSSEQIKLIDDFIFLAREKTIRLFIRNWKNGLKRQTVAQTILFYLSILFLKNRRGLL